jgi:hypothetical protein
MEQGSLMMISPAKQVAMSTPYACHNAETGCKELLTFQDVI